MQIRVVLSLVLEAFVGTRNSDGYDVQMRPWIDTRQDTTRD